MKNVRWGALATALGAAFACGGAMAESTYGYAAAGAGTVTATARVNLQVTVAKLILLRVGSPNAVVDTVAWTVGKSIPGVPTAPANGNNTAVDWNGAAPTTPAVTNPAAVNVYAWTNATTPTINCGVGAWTGPVGGPANANFTVTVAGATPVPHPGANLGACASTNFTANTLLSGTWAYALGGTPGTWPAGVYSTTVTYTATGL
ncbi:MAG TPA: hypothetical protein VNB23_04695 [Ramlibacter sp.]|nr:hypothetical protein [Ramlibacter sp.]